MVRSRSLERLDPIEPLARFRLLRTACVLSDAQRCVQCGVCTYNCPMGLDVRRHAHLGRALLERACLTCGECIRRCPRAALRFAPLPEPTP